MTRVVVLDVESTGKERSTDQIIELCLQLGIEDDAMSRTWRILPTIPIPAEATGVHGITIEMLAGCPYFNQAAVEFMPILREAEVIVGYNVGFDVDMLQAELARAGLPHLELVGKYVVDVLRLWQHHEPRTLVAACLKFCGVDLADAHRASADVAATARVLTAMRHAFGHAETSWPDLAAVSNPFPGREAWIGPSHHVQWSAEGEAVFAFGKHKGTRVDQVDVGFLKWVLSKDFPRHVKRICTAAGRAPSYALLHAWLLSEYPRQLSLSLEEPPAIVPAPAASEESSSSRNASSSPNDGPQLGLPLGGVS